MLRTFLSLVLLPFIFEASAQSMSWEEKLSDKYRLDVPKTKQLQAAADAARAKSQQEEQRQAANIRENARQIALKNCNLVRPEDCERLAQIAELQAVVDFWQQKYPNEPQRWQKYAAELAKLNEK